MSKPLGRPASLGPGPWPRGTVPVGPNANVETIAGDPRCNDICRGERSAMDSPARYGRDGLGKKVLWCTCCRGMLRLSSLKDYSAEVSAVRLGGSATAGMVRLYECPVCRYDVQSISEIT